MSRIWNKDTKPEMIVRRLVHGMGYRYRLHRKDLPGRSDLVFPSRRKVIYVHGCFWHRHPDPDCKLARLPKSRLDFWLPKLNGNRERDERRLHELSEKGWSGMVVWECETNDPTELEPMIRAFLDPAHGSIAMPTDGETSSPSANFCLAVSVLTDIAGA